MSAVERGAGSLAVWARVARPQAEDRLVEAAWAAFEGEARAWVLEATPPHCMEQIRFASEKQKEFVVAGPGRRRIGQEAMMTKRVMRDMTSRDDDCTCARMNNCYGRGGWWVSGDCPNHGPLEQGDRMDCLVFSDSSLVCTLNKGHEGCHAAHGSNRFVPLAVWE